MPGFSLPQDIVLLICQELALRRDFDTLFQCALVSRRVATVALEQLYRCGSFTPFTRNIHGMTDFEQHLRPVSCSV